jgi:hypothetical protein
MQVEPSSGLAHRRGKSSLSSTGSGAARSRINYADAPPLMISPPSQAIRFAGNGPNGMAYNSPPGAMNRLPSSSSGYDRSPQNGSNPVQYGVPIAPNGVQQPYAQAQSSSFEHAQSNGASSVSQQQIRTRPRRPDTEEIKRVARIHYEELIKFLRSHLSKGKSETDKIVEELVGCAKRWRLHHFGVLCAPCTRRTPSACQDWHDSMDARFAETPFC